MRTIRAASACKASLEQSFDADQANVLYRALLEKALQDAVTSFQRLCEQLYDGGGWKGARRNAFQNLQEGSELWNAAIGIGYEQLLNVADLTRVGLYFQQRHVIAHQQGIVDQGYISKTGDTSYTLGQRLILNDVAVLEFADLVEGMGKALIQAVAAARAL